MSGVLEDFDENDSEQADMSEIGIRKLRALARGQEYPISEHDQEHAAGLSPPVLDIFYFELYYEQRGVRSTTTSS